MRTFHHLSLLTLLSILISACGKNPQPQLQSNNNPSPANTPSASPTPSVSPQPSPTPASSQKWSQQEIDDSTTSCANRGDSSFELSQWSTFCRCSFTEASKRWTFDQFYDDFNTNYTTLYSDGVIQKCLDKAGIKA